MTEQNKTITLSVVSHLQQALVKQLLDDVIKYDLKNIKILLTINTEELLDFEVNALPFPIQVIKNNHPMGFGANHNQAFTFCKTDYFCVLNPDILLTENPFPVLLETLNKYAAAVIAPRVIDTQGNIENSVRKFPTPISILKKILIKNRKPDYKTDKLIVNPDWVGGMFMLFRSDTFQRIGGFDERYFLYYEDVDICKTLHQAGHTILYSPNCSVVHEARRTSHKNLKFLSWHLSSMVKFFIKWLFRTSK